jgi:Ca2+-binding EF-hand superfamily protein
MCVCRKVFDIVDRDRSGFLSKREAKRACKLIAEKFGVSEVNKMHLIFVENKHFVVTKFTKM